MARPISFEGANLRLKAPEGSTDVMDILVFHDQPRNSIIQCWALDPPELAKVAETGQVWLRIIGGLPPVYISGIPLMVYGDQATHEIVTQEKLDALKRIKERLESLGPEWFEGDNPFAATLRDLRNEATHA